MDRVTLYFKEAARIAAESDTGSSDADDHESRMARAFRMIRIQREAKLAVERQLGKLRRIRRRTRA